MKGGLLRTYPRSSSANPLVGALLKHLLERKEFDASWRQVLLASETGSKKSLAYILPMLQDLKQTSTEHSAHAASTRL